MCISSTHLSKNRAKTCISNTFGPNSKTCTCEVRAAWGRVSRGLTVMHNILAGIGLIGLLIWNKCYSKYHIFLNSFLHFLYFLPYSVHTMSKIFVYFEIFYLKNYSFRRQWSSKYGIYKHCMKFTALNCPTGPN